MEMQDQNQKDGNATQDIDPMVAAVRGGAARARRVGNLRGCGLSSYWSKASISFSSITGTPSAFALSSFDPASMPATT